MGLEVRYVEPGRGQACVDHVMSVLEPAAGLDVEVVIVDDPSGRLPDGVVAGAALDDDEATALGLDAASARPCLVISRTATLTSYTWITVAEELLDLETGLLPRRHPVQAGAGAALHPKRRRRLARGLWGRVPGLRGAARQARSVERWRTSHGSDREGPG